jgi:uncharacterized membrane protein
MKKKVSKKGAINSYLKKPEGHPSLNKSTPLTFSQKCSDWLSEWLGSWFFIGLFLVVMVVWIFLNVQALIGVWDPYPFILLNFVLSCLAAIQAPIILMSQNRQEERDRISFRYDYQVNRKAEREIEKLVKEVRNLKRHIYERVPAKKKRK